MKPNIETEAEEKPVSEGRLEKFARRVASMLSRGNISLQAGNFETKEDIDARREALKAHQF